REKEYKLTDSHGLYLLVKPTGSKRWYLKYRFEGKESRVALGAYLSESVKHRYYQCVNVLCSATFRSMEAVD
ncbi:integrase arm-type DNA-binding domain-containing protein, partial [Klebsiella pneumoniae]|uniref:integrase arm-type DNA-binding domain-containing protein n=2 Tax=Enterobacteriaceae TaxID=543 RepID=UPI0025A0FD89